MQTFLPYASFKKSAEVLDNKRLGKQRVEALQIVKALRDPLYGWQNHPAVKMWYGYDNSIISYGIFICDEWRRRGFKDTVREKLLDLRISGTEKLPPFIGEHVFHASHRSNLIRKDPVFYGKYDWTEGPDLPYYWPTLTRKR